MRDLPKLLPATLPTLLLALGPAAGPAAARHGTRGTATRERHGAGSHATPPRGQEARAKRRAGTRAGPRASRHAAREQARANRTRPANANAPTRAPATPQRRRAATASAAAIAAVLATPCQNTSITPTAENQAHDPRRGALPDQQRARRTLAAAAHRQRAARSAAEGHCAELVADDYFAHVSPSGETPVDRIKATGYIPNSTVGYVIGENLAWGTYSLSTPQAIVEAWVASPGHLANILESRYTETGIGITPAVPAVARRRQPRRHLRRGVRRHRPLRAATVGRRRARP